MHGMRVRWQWVALGLGLGPPGPGCAQLPDVVRVDAVQGDTSLADIDPNAVDETVFDLDLPIDVAFDVVFDETMQLPSARDHVRVEDQEGDAIDVDISARLQTLRVTPWELLEAGQNHTLVIEAAIEDNSGTTMLEGYRIAFFTAEATTPGTAGR
jgi:hypothetical protein